MRKLHCFYKEVEIVECLPNSCYKLKDKKTGRTLPFKVHVSRLKHMTKDAEKHAKQQATSPTTPPTEPAQTGQTTASPPITPAPQAQKPTAPPTDIGWYAIKGILRRRRRPTGVYEYLVQWQVDDSTSWLLARDINPEVVRAYNTRCRQRRRHY